MNRILNMFADVVLTYMKGTGVINVCVVGSLHTYVYFRLYKLSRTETLHLPETACVHCSTMNELYVVK
jgi:hypothetical protein